MILNWALFPIDSSKAPIENRLPSQPQSTVTMHYCLRGYSAPQPKETVYKVGRSTGFTAGIVNPAHSFIHVLEAPSMRGWLVEPGTEHQQIPELTRASAVCVVAKDKDAKFAGPGILGLSSSVRMV